MILNQTKFLRLTDRKVVRVRITTRKEGLPRWKKRYFVRELREIESLGSFKDSNIQTSFLQYKNIENKFFTVILIHSLNFVVTTGSNTIKTLESCP